MFFNEELQEHLETSSTIRINSLITAEWNMNVAENILLSGNYRYRPNDEENPQYNFISQSFEINDEVNNFYTGATDADVVIDGGFDELGIPQAFVSKKEKEKLLYSLEDCFGRFRPRSGINKLRYFDNRYSHFSNIDLARRPRYYIADKQDPFKYWTSYRTEDGIERGIANINLNDNNFIHDAAPFVVYRDVVPANRIVVKMQTHIGDLNLGPFIQNNQTINDPFFGEENKATPVNWRIQYLQEDNSWIDAAVFDENSVRPDDSPIIKEDGYVELFYGLVVPEKFRNSFELVKELPNDTFLPDPTNIPNGTAYFVKTEEEDPGILYIVDNNGFSTDGLFESYPAEYGWRVDEADVSSSTQFVKELVNPPTFVNPSNSSKYFREFQYIRGLRIVVETINVFDSSLDLIELSPRLAVDISDKVSDFSITRSASDLGVSGLPIGQLLASVGTINIFDYDQAFFEQNPNSIVAKYSSQNIQFKFYETVREVEGKDFYIPIKTMYSEGFPEITSSTRAVSMQLRDLFFYLESITAPQLFITNVSVSYAIALILDYLGFSNYVFFRNPGEDEEVIPYFFVEPDQSVADILNKLATSTQTAMFFDEFNNFIVMSKGYILPSESDRPVNAILRGTKDFEQDGALKNKKTKSELANIQEISFVKNEIFNDGIINYSRRSIQRSYGTIREASVLDKAKTWVYKNVLLWEITGEENVRSSNEEIQSQSEYALTAIPLNSDLTATLPSVENHRVINNTIDFGDGVYWTARFNGYFFSNGELIRYDAIQFSIPGILNTQAYNPNIEEDNVWISSISEYQNYFSKIPFNGKIYPTGLVRIYTEPHFEVVNGQTRMKNGAVAKHGRGQFGTEIVDHHSGLDEYWSDIANRRGLVMDFKYLFSERINRIRYSNVAVEENFYPSSIDINLEESEIEKGLAYSKLLVEDASLAKIGDYVFREFDGEAVDENEELIGPPTTNLIGEGARIVEIDSENNLITIDRPVTNISSEDLVAVDNNLSSDYFEAKDLEFIEDATATVINVSSRRVLTLASGTNMNLFKIGMDVKNKTTASGNRNIIPENSKISSIDKNRRRVTLNKKLSSVSSSAQFTISAGKTIFGATLQLDAEQDMTELIPGLYVKDRRGSGILNTTVDLPFNIDIGSGPNEEIKDFAIQSDGKIIIVGNFTKFNNTTANRVIRLNANGTVDSAFVEKIGNAADGPIEAIVVQSDGKIVLGGDFINFNGTSVNRIVRLNANGTRDTAFSNNTKFGANNTIKALAVQSNNGILVGGSFNRFNNATRNKIVRLDSAGRLTAGFSNNIAEGFAPFNSTVNKILLQPNNQILVGGDFTSFRATNSKYLARLNSTGAIDSAFTTNGALGLDAPVKDMAIHTGNKILMVGEFVTFSGLPVNRIVRLNTNGSIDSAFSKATLGGANDTVNSVSILSDNRILFAGAFTAFNGQVARRSVVLMENGSIDSFAFITESENTFDNTVIKSRVQSDGKILSIGSFQNFDEVLVSQIARLVVPETPKNLVPVNENVIIVSVDIENKRITLNKNVINPDTEENTAVALTVGRLSLGDVVLSEIRPDAVPGRAGIDQLIYKNSSISGVIKNILSTDYREEKVSSSLIPSTVQSSALVFKGNVINSLERPREAISYVYRELDNRFRHFGTRMRIVGRIENNESRGQTPEGASTYYTIEQNDSGQEQVLAGGSGGLAIMINSENNNGYYFEIAAMTGNNLEQYSEDEEFGENNVNNIFFYKIQRSEEATLDTEKAIPIKLFSGVGSINVDEGTFVGQGRLASEKNTTVYDLAVEYEDFDGARLFYLYINNVMVGTARDENPLPVVNNLALFVRGNAKCMFENVYALTENYSQNTTFSLETPVNSVFGRVDLTAQSSLQKYALSGLIQSTYLSGIGSSEPPKYNIYYEEFGTIMREAAYFNIRYDKAYPALSAQISPTANRTKGYTVSGFIASAYGADFLIFNHTDSVLNVDSTSGNYLRIQGATFTQQSTSELTVDEYFEKRTNFADPKKVSETLVESPIDAKKYYTDIKLNRLTQGRKEFVLDSPYLQSQDAANKMMKWIVEKVMKPRKSAGIRVFGMPNLQLGDIVQIDYSSNNDEDETKNFNEISDSEKRFVIYHIEYSRNLEGLENVIYVTEVPE